MKGEIAMTTINLNTMADFKRACTVGAKIRGGYFYKGDARMQQVGVITAVQSNGCWIKRDGEKASFFEYPKASLCDFNGDTMIIHEEGWRGLTLEEKATLDGWRKIAETPEFKQRAEVDALTDGSSTYYQERTYFKNAGMLHLFEYHNGVKLDFRRYNDGEHACVRDNSTKGMAKVAEYQIVDL